MSFVLNWVVVNQVYTRVKIHHVLHLRFGHIIYTSVEYSFKKMKPLGPCNFVSSF